MRTVIATAERESDALVAQARSSARLRTHDVIEELRNEGICRLARAKAKVETEARQRAQQCSLEVIERAWPLLAEALIERWRDWQRVWSGPTASLTAGATNSMPKDGSSSIPPAGATMKREILTTRTAQAAMQ